MKDWHIWNAAQMKDGIVIRVHVQYGSPDKFSQFMLNSESVQGKWQQYQGVALVLWPKENGVLCSLTLPIKGQVRQPAHDTTHFWYSTHLCHCQQLLMKRGERIKMLDLTSYSKPCKIMEKIYFSEGVQVYSSSYEEEIPS